MEKYSKHLEAIVAERTQDLVAEKAKTDRLLYSKCTPSAAVLYMSIGLGKRVLINVRKMSSHISLCIPNRLFRDGE
ncbi:hypothetical protein DPMN_082948 [Dreissena polymorpha]|uniref:Uncharacterized protein n=1 Tax=Dreissena polymorpha TaxID=45954 RepID=A0A9D3Y7U1_DREPO|nr:hypothetical protein DPMN_082948 [Dreissena polymorpha]